MTPFVNLISLTLKYINIMELALENHILISYILLDLPLLEHLRMSNLSCAVYAHLLITENLLSFEAEDMVVEGIEKWNCPKM